MVDNDEDRILIQRAKENNERFESLYSKYSQTIFYYFWSRVGHEKALAEDLTQEVFLRAFRTIEVFELQTRSYLSYLLTIAHNLLVDYYRKPRSISIEIIDDIQISMREKIEDMSDAKLLWKNVERLTSIERKVVMMKYQKDARTRDIASTVHKSENAVRLILSRARKKLVYLT